MQLRDVTCSRLERAFGLYDELAASVPESALGERLPGLRSNTLGQQLWCVVGARESYGRAIACGEWKGFSCSLTGEQCTIRADVRAALERSAAEALRMVSVAGSWSERQCHLILDLVEHEAAHHGQIIRYLYGLNLPVPDGWKARYALD